MHSMGLVHSHLLPRPLGDSSASCSLSEGVEHLHTMCNDLRLQRVSMMQMNPQEDEAGGENERDLLLSDE
jgi:hypothetical protein